jgi:nucleoid DNA-binding protein
MTSKANINRKMMASMMAEASPDYLVYECEDFIDLFTEVIEQLVKEGHTIALDGFGTFQPKINPEFRTKDLQKTDDVFITYPESTTLKFTPAVSLQKRIKAYTKEKNDAVS